MKSAMAAVTPFWSGQLVRRIAVSVTLHLRGLHTGAPDYHSHRALPKLFHCVPCEPQEAPLTHRLCLDSVSCQPRTFSPGKVAFRPPERSRSINQMGFSPWDRLRLQLQPKRNIRSEVAGNFSRALKIRRPPTALSSRLP